MCTQFSVHRFRVSLCLIKLISLDFQVNEEGSEAAAATSFQIGLTCMPNQKEFHANRPFYFIIAHKPSRTPLFAGFVRDPESV